MYFRLVVKRFLKKIYNYFMGQVYRFDVFLGFRNERYVYRLITGASGFFPGKISEEDVLKYIEGSLVSDFKSVRISERGFYLFLDYINRFGSVSLYCAVSRVLFESRALSPKFKKFDRINDSALLNLLALDSGSALLDLTVSLTKANNPSWSSAFVYRLIGILSDGKKWVLLRYFSDLYVCVNPSNLFVNKMYVMARMRLGDFSSAGEFFVSDSFKSIKFIEQIELLEIFGRDRALDQDDFDCCDDDLARFYFNIFKRLITSGKIKGSVVRAIEEPSKNDAFRFIELLYKEKYLFGAEALELIYNLSGEFLAPFPSLQEIHEKIRNFDGSYGGLDWEKFVDDIYASINKLEGANCFSEKFLSLIGYSQDKVFSCGKPEIVGSNLEPIILVCNSRISKSFFSNVNFKYGFSQVVGYSAVAQSEIDSALCPVITVSDLVPQPGSPLDMEAYKISHEVSLHYFSNVLRCHNLGAWSEKFIREVFSLAIEDRLFGHIKRVVLLVEHLRVSKARKVVFSYKIQEYGLMSALAQAVHRSLGVECVLLREFGKFDLSRHYEFAFKSPLEVGFFDFINRCESFRFFSERSKKGSLLLLSSFGDAAYYKSAMQILDSSDYDKNYVFNLGDRFVGRSFLSGNVRLIEPCGVGSFDALNISFSELEGVGFGCEGSYSPYAEFIGYVFDAYIFKWIAKLKNQIEVILQFFEVNGMSSLITIPGRAPLSRAIILMAGASGLKTVDVQAFFISSMPRYKGSLADSYCAITRDQLDLYVDCHQRETSQRLYRIGSLMMDHQLSNVEGYTLDMARSEHKIGMDKFVVFFAEQHGDGGYSFDIARSLISSLTPSMYLIIKLHPRSPYSVVNGFSQLVKEYGRASQVSVTQAGHLYKLIVASDVVVTQFSNVGLEAAVLRKKVLSVLISGDEPVLDFGALGIADVVYSLEEMNSYVSRLVEGRTFDVSPYLLANPELGDGQSGRRVIDVSRGVGFYHKGFGAP